MAMIKRLKQHKAALITLGIGCFLGILMALSAEKVDELTTTDEFCSSCHAMQAYVADAKVYQTSTHLSLIHISEPTRPY